MTTSEAKKIIAFVAELLRGSRALHNIGLRECAKASGISFPTLSRIERGGVPDAITFLRLVAWLKKRGRI